MVIKKKIKNLSLDEYKKICINKKRCTYCPLYFLCANPLFLPRFFDEKEMEKEIEIEVD